MNKDLKIIKGILNILENYNEEYSEKDIAIIDGLNRIFNERWITVHPHGDDSDDYRRLKLEDGESPKEAIERVYKKEDKKEKGKKPNLSIKERIEQKRAESDDAYAKVEEVYKEISKFQRKIDALIGDITDNEEIRKIVDKFREENKEEEQRLIKKRDIADKEYQEKEEEFKEFKSQLADEIADIDIKDLNYEELTKLLDDVKGFSYLSGIPMEKRKTLQRKFLDIERQKDRTLVKEKADKVGGYTKKLNDLCEFTILSDISSYPEELQKHIYDNYKVVYDKYPQIKYGGLTKSRLGERTYAQNAIPTNKVTLNSTKYDNLEELKKSYEDCVQSKFHPTGTDYNSIIVHELGHALHSYIEKEHKIKPTEIRANVLKKVGIKQKDVKEHLSEYAMAKPREAHEFFAEAFSEYMTSKNPRPIAVEFGKEINRILQS